MRGCDDDLDAIADEPFGHDAAEMGFDGALRDDELTRDLDHAYADLLRATPTGVMGRLRVPKIAVDLPIYHGTSDAILAKGVGHLEGTSLPVGGASQHSVLTAHRGLPEAELFNDLDGVELGDRFTIEAFGEVLTYEVIDTRVVEPEDTDTLRAVAGEDLVTLVTCTPLGINSHRYLVTGERVTPTPIEDIAAAGQRPDVPGFPWWIAILCSAVLLAALLVVISGWRAAERTESKPEISEA